MLAWQWSEGVLSPLPAPQKFCPHQDLNRQPSASQNCCLLMAEPSVGGATVPYCDGCEQHHSGHIVQKCREDGSDETQDDDHGPHSPPGQLISLGWKKWAQEQDYFIIHMQRVNMRPVTVTWCGRGPHLACLRCVPGVSINRVLKLTWQCPQHVTASEMSQHCTIQAQTHHIVRWSCARCPDRVEAEPDHIELYRLLMLSSKAKVYVCQPLWTCSVWIYPIHAWNSAILLFLCYNTSGTDALTVLLSVMKIWN